MRERGDSVIGRIVQGVKWGLGVTQKKHLDKWLGGWARHLARRAAPRPGERVTGARHLLFAYCDHWEPLWGDVDHAHGTRRVQYWTDNYGKYAEGFVDADGLGPRHSFFFPGEQYTPGWLDALADMARRGWGEVEIHLHHDGDTYAKLKKDMERYIALFAKHGHLTRDKSGKARYAFIHGNWCLANARADGRWCGVDDELPLLWETGCYADFTFPSAPDECQPNIVNQIYWPIGDLRRKRAYEHAEPARVGKHYDDRMLMITGPLALARRPRSMKIRIESAAVTAKDPGTAARVKTWVDQAIHIEGRPEWIFVKIHTHGAPDREAAGVLGEDGRAMHRALQRYNDGHKWKLHYVSAREMYNIAMAALEGRAGDPNLYRDHVFGPPPVLANREGGARERHQSAAQ